MFTFGEEVVLTLMFLILPLLVAKAIAEYYDRQFRPRRH
jgi:hypothetical protein